MKDNYIGKKFTLDNFIVNNDNKNQYCAINNIVQKESKIYNPLCLFGSHNTGKTHLLKSIVTSEIFTKTKYTTMYNFSSSFVENLKNKTMCTFRDEYVNLDILCIDDFEFIINKEATQEEFYHIVNNLICLNKIVIISSSINYNKLSLSSKLYSLIKSGNII